jgi:hypothetical protein
MDLYGVLGITSAHAERKLGGFMRTGTKFWIAAGTVLLMVLLLVFYLALVKEKADGAVVGAFLGVITLTVGGYFTSNVIASAQPAPASPPAADPAKAPGP